MKCKDYITDRKEVTDLALDKDLQSIQEVRDLIAKAKDAERILSTFSQEKLEIGRASCRERVLCSV